MEAARQSLGIGHVEASPLTRSNHHAGRPDAVSVGDTVSLSFV
jgi:hypothetical protein